MRNTNTSDLILGTWNHSHAKFFSETSNFLSLKIGTYQYVLIHWDILIHLFSISLLGKNLVGQDAVVSSAKFSYQAPGRSQCIISYTHINLSSIINTNITINLSINLVNINTNISVSVDTLHAKRKKPCTHSGYFLIIRNFSAWPLFLDYPKTLTIQKICWLFRKIFILSNSFSGCRTTSEFSNFTENYNFRH